MRSTDFDIHKVIESLQGTAQSIDDALPEGMEWADLIDEDHNAIDNEIFLCPDCGWWCETSESTDRDGEDVCQDCGESDED